MSLAVLFPDVELVLTDYLRARLPAHGYTGVRVANTYKGGTLDVWVRRDGGPTLDQTREAARVSVNVFAAGATSQPVTNLARVVSALLRGAATGEPILRVTQNSGPSPVTDTVPRVFMSFDVTVRGVNL